MFGISPLACIVRSIGAMLRRGPGVLAFVAALIGLSSPTLAANVYVGTCECVTTSDYATVAARFAKANGWGGTFFLTSVAQASSAMMQVTGKIVFSGGEPVFEASAETPIDSSGNSLAGESESDLEIFYGVLDSTSYGEWRDGPFDAVIPHSGPFQTFAGTPDSWVSEFLNTEGALVTATMLAGDVVLVVFPDGTAAEYILGADNKTWTWNNKAWNSQKQPIDRNGNLIPNPHTSGVGGGSTSVSGFGPGSGWRFEMQGQAECSSTVTVYDEDGNVISSGSSNWLPC